MRARTSTRLTMAITALVLVTAPVFAFAGDAFAEESSYEVVDPDRIYYRSIRGKHPKAPGVLVASTVWAAIPEYQKIIEDDLTEDDAKYHLLMKKATERFDKALKKLAKRDKYDMLGEVGSIEARGEKPKEIPEVTDDLVELVSRD